MKRYTPDFPEMMRLCEMNFSQLRRLLPRNDAPGYFFQAEDGIRDYLQ